MKLRPRRPCKCNKNKPRNQWMNFPRFVVFAASRAQRQASRQDSLQNSPSLSQAMVNTCLMSFLCGRSGHVMPKFKFGKAICRSCNVRKGHIARARVRKRWTLWQEEFSRKSCSKNLRAVYGCLIGWECLARDVFIREKKFSNTKLLASRHIKREKASLPVDVPRSKTPLLKLPNTGGALLGNRICQATNPVPRIHTGQTTLGHLSLTLWFLWFSREHLRRT